MAFTIPNEASAAFADQAEPDSVHFDIIAQGLGGSGVISGCAVTAQGTPDMTVAVASGEVIVAGTRATVSAGNATIGAAHGSLPRFDLITVNSSGTKATTAGTAASNPVFPAIPASSVVLAAVYVPATDTAINSNQITDLRMILDAPNSYLDKVTVVDQTVAGAVQFNGDLTIFQNKLEIRDTFTPAYDQDLWIAGPQRLNPTVTSLAAYLQHRVTGDLGGVNHEAGAFELRLDNVSNASFLVGSESTVVVTGGANTIADLRGHTISFHSSGSPSGTVTNYKGLVVQNPMALAGTLVVTNAYGLVIEEQTRGTNNRTLYAPAGIAELGTLLMQGDLTIGSPSKTTPQIALSATTATHPRILFQKAGVDRWFIRTNATETGSGNTGSDLEIVRRDDSGANISTVLSILRSSGLVTLGHGLLLATGALTLVRNRSSRSGASSQAPFYHQA